MPYRERSFATRLGEMGDKSEATFDAIYPNHHKLGLNRPPMNVKVMPAIARYTPDRMLDDRFVECMGIGRDKTLKIKTEKIIALHQWKLIMPVDLFVADSTRGKWWQAPIEYFFDKCLDEGVIGYFPDNGKPYYSLHSDSFDLEAHDAPIAD